MFAVRSAIEIEAPPEIVWPQVIAFAELAEPEDWVFHLGIAYPMRAEIRGTGVGAVRHCFFPPGRLSSQSRFGMSRGF